MSPKESAQSQIDQARVALEQAAKAMAAAVEIIENADDVALEGTTNYGYDIFDEVRVHINEVEKVLQKM